MYKSTLKVVRPIIRSRCLYSTTSSTTTISTDNVPPSVQDVVDNHKQHEEGHYNPPRSFKAIVADMDRRKLAEEDLLKGDISSVAHLKANIGPKNRTSFLDFTAGFRVGDLIQSHNFGLAVIIKGPKGPDDEDIAICTVSGSLKFIRKRDIRLKLENFAPADMLKESIRELSVDGESVKVLKNDVRVAITGPLREFYRSAHSMAPLAKEALNDLLKVLAKDDQTISIPFFELVRMVQYVTYMKSQHPDEAARSDFYDDFLQPGFPLPKPTTKLHETAQPRLLYITSQLLERVFNNRALFDPFSQNVTVLSTKSVEMADNALNYIKREKVLNKINEMLKTHQSTSNLDSSSNGGGISKQVKDVLNYLKRYALRDFSELDSISHSAAISLLRHLEPFKGSVINSESALSIQSQLKNLNEYHGPQIESERFAAVNHELNSSLLYGNFSTSLNEFPDSMTNLRHEDTTGRRVYCIDSTDAEEIDDGISIRRTKENSWKIGVHVADPASAFMVGTSHLNEILNRAYRVSSTAYMPRESVPMLPKEFKEAFGLVNNNDGRSSRRCLTFEFDYNPVKGIINERSIHVRPQLVENIISLTYDQVDTMLNESKTQSSSHEDLHDLHSVARDFHSVRKRNGAIDVDVQGSFSVKVQDPENNDIGEPDVELMHNQVSASNFVVSEMMILANHLTAGFTKSRRIPNIYRAQVLNFTDSDCPIGLRQRMKSATLSPIPYAHESMGLNYYTHVTSPLRRFQDLISHWQLEAYLSRGKIPMLERSQIAKIATCLHATQATLNQAQKQSDTYWTLRKIESAATSNQSQIPFDCTLIRNSTRSSQMAFCNSWGINALVEGIPKDLKAGEKFSCSLARVNSNQYKLVLAFKSTL